LLNYYILSCEWAVGEVTALNRSCIWSKCQTIGVQEILPIFSVKYTKYI